MREIGVGIIGFGTVGTGVVKILQGNGDLIAERMGGRLAIRKIADIDLERKRDVEVPSFLLTTDAHEVIRDPGVDVVVELIGGEEPARSFILEAIREGKHVVTANKALLAHWGKEIFEAAKERGVQVGFEASVGGGIPIIRSLTDCGQQDQGDLRNPQRYLQLHPYPDDGAGGGVRRGLEGGPVAGVC